MFPMIINPEPQMIEFYEFVGLNFTAKKLLLNKVVK